jgi:hypothetical protein
MKKSFLILSGLAISALLTSCGENSPLTNDSEKAQKYITKACGSSKPDLSWQARTNLAAEAYSLDKTWEKFYEATSSLAAVDAVSKNPSEWVNADGNDGLQMAYLNAKMYSIYVAECAKLVVNE